MQSSPRRTKIVCTIGPASESEETLRQMVRAGMNVARLNFSHGEHDWHARVYGRLRRVAEGEGAPLAVLQDLCGPRIRVGRVAAGTLLQAGTSLALTPHEVEGTARRIHVSYPRLAQEVAPGDRVLLDDGLLELAVEKIQPPEVHCRVVVGGPLHSHKGVNFPGARLGVPAFTEKDEQDLRFGLELGVDLVALSFVRRAADAEPVRRVMAGLGIRRPLVAKIEKQEAVDAIDEILEAFDAVMVARGDLGIEVPLEQVPLIQKDLAEKSRERERPVIIATQMLDSMIRNPRPTRAEVTDVANAILDGADAVMLSGETASGAYPVRSVEVMSRVAQQAETRLPYTELLTRDFPRDDPVATVALAACEIAEVLNADAILACTASGRTARAIARYRPRIPVLGVTSNPEVGRQVGLVWGVTPVVVEPYETTDELTRHAVQAARRSGLVRPGNTVVITAGAPEGCPTNMIRIHRLD